MQLPTQLIESLSRIESFDQEAFLNAHRNPEEITSIRINPIRNYQPTGEQYSKVPWSEYGYYINKRPSFTFDPLFHAGCYYVQEASSMFLEQAIRQTVDLSLPLKVLDLSAAPGGKSTHLQSLLSNESLLVSNEVIRSRANILKDNLIKWGSRNVVITNNDPRDFKVLPEYFDVIVIDAPCSGSGLFRRDADAITEWSPQNVALCSQRQQRILADILPALKPGGILIYSTCSYSEEEDEDIVNWMTGEFPLSLSPIKILPEWGVVDSGGGYRFWPDKIKGEGFFLACFQKLGESETQKYKAKNKPTKLEKKEIAVLDKWVNTQDLQFIRHDQTVYGWPFEMAEDFNLLLNQLKLVYSGTIIGELIREKLVPAHALALSTLVNKEVPQLALTNEEAIEYLQRKDLSKEVLTKGWQMVSYLGFSLGWVNVLPNRINNYYPKELRILKDKPA